MLNRDQIHAYDDNYSTQAELDTCIVIDMSKKRVGLAAFDKDLTNARFKTFGTDLINSQYSQLSSQLETFQQALSAFAATHARQIRANPEFRAQFNQMCTAIGINPLSSSASGKSVWGDMLGLGDLYHDLAVQVIEICRRTKVENGGLISVSEVSKKINDRANTFGSAEVCQDDIVRAVKGLKVLESGFEVITIGSQQLIRSVPQELNQDQSVVLEAAQITGSVSISMLRLNFRWERERAKSVLEDLLGAGMLWIDDQGPEIEYWVPSSIDEG